MHGTSDRFPNSFYVELNQLYLTLQYFTRDTVTPSFTREEEGAIYQLFQ